MIWCMTAQRKYSLDVMTSIQKHMSEIASFCYSQRQDIVNAHIPNGVEIIRDSAFFMCSNLSSIFIPCSVKKIEDNAFAKCYSLSEIIFPDSVEEIGTDICHRCINLKKCVISNNVHSIPSGAFDRCFRLNEVTLHDGIKTIGESSFAFCFDLKKINFGKSLKEIGRAAFSSSGIENVQLNNKVTHIGDMCFSDCKSLRQVSLPPNINISYDNVFKNCSCFIHINQN